MNKRPPQSAGGGGLASISMVSSKSSVVVIGFIDGGIYIGLDVVDSYIGCSVIVVDSMSVWLTSITIASVPINHKKYQNVIKKSQTHTEYYYQYLHFLIESKLYIFLYCTS